MQKKELLNKLFVEDKTGKEYIVFYHSDKTWIMPDESLEPALEMYQPSTIKGKILKSCIKLFHNNKNVLSKVGAQKKSLLLKQRVLEYLQEITGEEHIYVAAYMGDTTTRQNNKATLQVYNAKRILCYVKVSEEPEVLENFSREVNSLKYLNERGIENIPRVLGEKQLENLRFFVQSTNKPLKQQVQLEFGRKQIEFIDNIVKKTQMNVTYETSEFYNSVQYLKEHIQQFADREKSLIDTAIKRIEMYEEEKGFQFAFCHGDYTPWNIYYVDGELFAFDFEYCYQTMPCYMDVFHYLTQFSLMGQHNDAEKTILLYQENKKKLKEYVVSPDIVYVCYLLHIIAFYHNRTNGRKKLLQEQMGFWMRLLEHFIFSGQLSEQ